MEMESVIEKLRPLEHKGAIRIKFPHKRAFVGYLHKVNGIPVSVESETMNIPLSALAGVSTLIPVVKAYPDNWKG